MTSLSVLDLIKQGESEHVEFKASVASVERIGATVCAFLNQNGGTILLGVTGNGEIEGLSNPTSHVQRIQDYLLSKISPKVLWSATVESVDLQQIISIGVPAGKDRPYTCDGKIYIRVGAQTQMADTTTIRALAAAQFSEPIRWERLPSLGLEIADLDQDSIRKTVDGAISSRSYRFRNSQDIALVLEDLALQRSGQLTNAAAVLFGQNTATRLPQTRVRATMFSTDKGGASYIDDQLFEGNAFDLLQKTTAFLQKHVSIQVDFSSSSLIRGENPQYPFPALREALVNALVHRDYSNYSGGMSIGIYPTRIEIWNSGQLAQGLGVNDLKRPHPSLPTNPDIAHVFFLRGMMERIGRGTQKIAEEFRTAKLPSPVWRVSASGITLVLSFKKGIKATFSLNVRQRMLIERLSPGNHLKPSDYYKEMAPSVTQRQAQRDLMQLEQAGWLRREGAGPATTYRRTEKGWPSSG